MEIDLHTDERGDLGHRAPVACPVQPVEDALGAPLGEQGRELSPREAADAFSREFELALARIRDNERIVNSTHLVHGRDGVLRVPAASSKNDSENLSEGGGR